MPRWRNARDANDLEIFNALKTAGRNPLHGRDADIYCDHVRGFGVLLEVKTKNGVLRPLQASLKAMFKDRYFVVRSSEEALRAVGAIL